MLSHNARTFQIINGLMDVKQQLNVLRGQDGLLVLVLRQLVPVRERGMHTGKGKGKSLHPHPLLHMLVRPFHGGWQQVAFAYKRAAGQGCCCGHPQTPVMHSSAHPAWGQCWGAAAQLCANLIRATGQLYSVLSADEQLSSKARNVCATKQQNCRCYSTQGQPVYGHDWPAMTGITDGTQLRYL
eukprot:scaffold45295_cov19-Tisochrysis_lutea.AAC.4